MLLTDESLTSPLSPASSGSRHRASSSASSLSVFLENIAGHDAPLPSKFDPYNDKDVDGQDPEKDAEFEDGIDLVIRPVSPRWRRSVWIVVALSIVVWIIALVLFLQTGTYKHRSSLAHDPDATESKGSGKKITLEQVLSGAWGANMQNIKWIAGANGEDGLLLEQGVEDKDYLIVEDIRSRLNQSGAQETLTLMKKHSFYFNSDLVSPQTVWPSKNLEKVLVVSDAKGNWRHSFTGRYWIFDVATQTGEPLNAERSDMRMQLASWSPKSDAVVYVYENNMYLRTLTGDSATSLTSRITENGGPNFFNGVPDWVYEEEVFHDNSAIWWSPDGQYIAFLSTNETEVPTFPIDYFLSRPTGAERANITENYPYERLIKYPKAGAPNPIVNLRFYDVQRHEGFDVEIDDDFDPNTRVITEVVWVGESAKVLVKEIDRSADVLKVILIDIESRTGRVVRNENAKEADDCWVEVTSATTFVPRDPAKGRLEDGYVDTIIHDGYSHLGYFTPLDSAEPRILTSGKWEVVDAPSAIDVKNNLVYFSGTKEGSITQNPYSVNLLQGSDPRSLTDTRKESFYSASYSTSAGYCLLTYEGPDIPWQKVINTHSVDESFDLVLEKNEQLSRMAREHEVPLLSYQTVEIDGYELNVLERRPPHFDPKKHYPVLFYGYGGPGSQMVTKKFAIDTQSYFASNLGYIVLTVDGRGTGNRGRKTRCAVRDNLGHWEAHDQIATAKIWGKRSYVDKSRMAIWGWSYGGYLTLKTLEQDAGETFRYGMAVAPVTDWRFYGEYHSICFETACTSHQCH